MAKKKDKIIYSGNVPLRDRGILAKPLSCKETELERQIEAGRKYLEENPQVHDTSIDLFGAYKSWVNSTMPGVAEADRNMVYQALASLRLVIQQAKGHPTMAKITQYFFPCPLPADKVRAMDPKFKVSVVPLQETDRILTVEGRPVRNRLVVSMDYDLTRPLREQVLEYSQEAEIMATQYCVFRDSKGDDDETPAAAAT